MTTLRERSIAGKLMIPLRLGYIDKLLTARVRPVERYWFNRHFFRAILLSNSRPNPLSGDQRRSIDERTQIALIFGLGLGINQILEGCLVNKFHAPCDFF